MQLLSIDEISKQLKELNGWSYGDDHIYKNFELNNFSSSLSFSIQIGIEAEKMDHHPDILLHGWNNCKVKISTHSAGGVTEKDFLLAKKIEELNL